MDSNKIVELITMPVEILLENKTKVVGNVFSIDPETFNFIITIFKNENEIESIEFIPKMTIVEFKVLNKDQMLEYPKACFKDKEFISKIFEQFLPNEVNTKNYCEEDVLKRQKSLLEFLEIKKIQQVKIESETQAILIAKNFRINPPYEINDIVCSMPHILKRMKVVLQPFYESY